MQRFGRNKWEEDSALYSEEQVAAVLRHIGIHIDSDTNTHYLCFCPFHNNNDTTAFAVDKVKGLYHCFSPTCAESGTLIDLVKFKTHDQNEFKALRIILKYRGESTPFAKELDKILETTDNMPDVDPGTVERLYNNFKESEYAQLYMHRRGFEDETLDHFKIGYSAKKDLISVPMHDVDGKPVGFIGRRPSFEDKVFKNSVGLPKARTCWNIHRAKRHGSIVIICEASFDAMRIHQAGFPHVVALLGGSLTEWHVKQLGRFFDTVIIMTDFDARQIKGGCRVCEGMCRGHRPGRQLGRAIANAFKDKRVYWGCYSDEEVFPRWVKDVGDMTDDEIRACIYNAKTDYEYTTKRLEDLCPNP